MSDLTRNGDGVLVDADGRWFDEQRRLIPGCRVVPVASVSPREPAPRTVLHETTGWYPRAK